MKNYLIFHLILATCLLTPLLAKDHPTEILNPDLSEETTQRWMGLWPSLTQEALDLGMAILGVTYRF